MCAAEPAQGNIYIKKSPARMCPVHSALHLGKSAVSGTTPGARSAEALLCCFASKGQNKV